jgi:protein tyrosine phosphatase (PTP) superfamily phosphohydrolase (DUF442 family)
MLAVDRDAFRPAEADTLRFLFEPSGALCQDEFNDQLWMNHRGNEMSIESSLNFRRVSGTVTTSGTVAAEDLAELRARGYDIVVNLMPDNSEYAVEGEEAIIGGQAVDYSYIPIDFGAPSHDEFEEFAAVMDANVGKSIHVHCAANYRVSAFYSLYAMRQGWWTTEEADEHLSSIWTKGEYPVWDNFIAAERERLAR